LIEKEGMKETLYVIDKKFSKYNKYQIQSIDIYSCWKFALIAATLNRLYCNLQHLLCARYGLSSAYGLSIPHLTSHSMLNIS
jgi:hypothetical protein